MYKKILSLNSQASGGLNKAENATSTITLKDLKTPSPILSANNVHHHHQHHQANANEKLQTDTDVNDENAPCNFALMETNVVNSSDKVICEDLYERPLALFTQALSPSSHHVSLSSPPPPKMEIDDYTSEHTYPTHKSIHHTTTHYHDMMVDENLENKQQNFVNEEDDVWRPW